ncbi:hypothetical protein KC19_3G196900 [Ceratodon purpureus]|uniref:C2H2-type domain-containing protein n=1 Tax=Ceratodon purpureus TaxID=3225 RepID=A0A8T0IML1_CERPU|nr:hypothetical protein KC19_3G196900 [Ceratodon purpureus]
MRGLACNACNEVFADEEAQKQHYKTEWHRYNLRRKVAGVPGVTEALFNLRIEALEAEKKKKEGERLLYKCALCNKEYTTEKAHANHLQSKLHVTRAAGADAPADAGVPGTRPAPQKPSAAAQEASKPQNGKAVLDEEEESDDEWEEVDGEDVDAEEDGDTVAEMEEAGPSDDPLSGHWEPSDCLFCGKNHADFEACIEHMHRDHGFFVPDAEYLKDPVGMLTYLGLKITKGYMCLFCDERGKQFHSVEAVRKHMINKSHCKLRYGDGEGIAEEELEDFYDFSSSYKTAESSQVLALHDGANPLVSLASGGHELVIKSGDDEGSVKRIGSRDMARYFRQRPAPTDNRNGMMVNALVARYRSMGLATQEQKWRLRNKPEEQQRKASQRAEYIRSKIALKNNVIRNLPRNCEF